MAGTGNSASREERREEVGRRFLRGETQVTIAQALGCSSSQVSRDLGAMKKRWKASAKRSQEEMKTEAIARVEETRRCFWLGWEASLEPREVTIQEKRSGGGEGVRVTVRREVTKGDPRFLDGVARADERRAKLLGLDAPARCEVSAVSEEPMDKEQALAEIRRLTVARIPWELIDPNHFAPEYMPPGFPPPPPAPPMTEDERLSAMLQALDQMGVLDN